MNLGETVYEVFEMDLTGSGRTFLTSSGKFGLLNNSSKGVSDISTSCWVTYDLIAITNQD